MPKCETCGANAAFFIGGIYGSQLCLCFRHALELLFDTWFYALGKHEALAGEHWPKEFEE